ncbi:amidohydrolase family protein [Ovoidimarina sediminis]|uniref:amidohydrolase family protein n=1 Tax=Ovoidimarina sediminis TaxID=3079856 RepID=UPI002907D1CF|nr:amidohydrolase family protein [Rhodophyticola sp. MJ-SS7]MDU8944376.1 amidohydrolase family protein [Rhodophyticola sp. MJ-SS7]
MAGLTMTGAARAALEALAAYLEARGAGLTIDGDVHPSDRDLLPEDVARRIAEDPEYYHTKPVLPEELLPVMDMAGVDMALCWQNPGVLPYGADLEENAARLTEANRRIAALAARHPRRIIPAGWTDPKALGVENAIALVRRCVAEFGMPVVKMNPAQNAYPITDPMVYAVIDAIAETGAVPAFHFGSDTPFTPTEGLLEIARHLGDHPVIGVHMGGGGGHFVEAEATYQSAREAGLRQENIFYVLSAKRDVHMANALIAYADAGGSAARRIAVASDAPYGNIPFNFGGFRALFDALRDGAHYPDARLKARPGLFDDAMVQGFMGGNLAALVAAAARRVLERA